MSQINPGRAGVPLEASRGRVGMFKTRLSPTPVVSGLLWSQHKTMLRKQGYLGTVQLETCRQKPPVWKAWRTFMIYQGAGSSWAIWEVLWRLSHSREEEQLIKLCLLLHRWPIFKGRFRRRKMKLLFVEFLHAKIHTYITDVKGNKKEHHLEEVEVWSLNCHTELGFWYT